MAAIKLPAVEMGEVGKGTHYEVWVQWLNSKYKESPNLFYHWKIAHPYYVINTFVIEKEEPCEAIVSSTVP